MSNEMDDLKEAFLIESSDLLNQAEECLLALEKGASFKDNYNIIFRALHSIKGGAGMLAMEAVQSLLHEAESKFQSYKDSTSLAGDNISYFLKIIDNTRTLLSGNSLAPEARVPANSPTHAASQTTPNPDELQKKIENVSKGKPLKAVVIDDEPILVETLCSLLQSDHFEVRGHTTPKSAIDEIPKFDPDIVLCDMKMPGYTGLDVLREINQNKKHYPVVFISGYLDKDTLLSAVNQGAEGVIEKPFDTDYVSKLASRIARKSRLAVLFEQTLNLLLYQYSDFDDYLRATGKSSVRTVVETEMKNLMEQRRLLRELSKR